MDDTVSEKTDIIQSVSLALQILEVLAGAESDLGVTALADQLGTTKSRIHRHLRTLLALGYISQSKATERYRIGSRLISLGRAASGAADFAGLAQKHMRDLRERFGQAVSIGQVEDRGIRILSTMAGTHQVEVGVRAGSLLGFASSAQGKIAMSYLPNAKFDEILARGIEASTEYTICEPDALRQHIDQIAKQGWATAPNEALLGLNALACPIFGSEGDLVGTIAIVGLTQHIQTPPDPDQVAGVQAAAKAISAELGYSGA